MDEKTRKDITRHRSIPVTTADLKALDERVTELRRKMPDDEPCTILARLHEDGEFLWADEAHVEGALLWLEEQAAKVGYIGLVGQNSREIAERISEAAGEMVAQTITEDLLKDDAEWLADELAKGRPQRA